jgi:S1-C subfamily serine protease
VRFFLTALLAFTLSIPAFAFDVSQVVKSVLPITHEGSNICTASLINSAKHYWLTANHCVPDPDLIVEGVTIQIGGQTANPIARDFVHDMAILQVPGLSGGKALRLALRSPNVGQKVYVYGHPLGYPDPQLFRGYIASVDSNLGGEHFMTFDMTVCGGNSGSAVLNEQGEVVSVLQVAHGRPCDGFSGGAVWSDLVKFQGYFGR